MASIPITINGVICDLYGRTITGPVKIVGEAMYSGLHVGGGPMPPGEGGDKPPVGGKPPGIWPGPGDPDWPAGMPHPEHPIVLPPTPPGFPNPPPDGLPVKPPPAGGGWGYHPDYGWGYFPGPGEATPKG